MNIKNNTTCCHIISELQKFWSKIGCIIVQPLDIMVGAGTFHYCTFLRTIGPEPLNMAYLQTSRRPTDGRYGNNPNRLQQYYQFQVIIKPAPKNIQFLYLQSLKKINLDLTKNDIRFVEDNWENPTLGAWGIGWEVWLNGMEITQFTYFQQMGGLECDPITVEITYGLERIAMNIQNVNTIYEIIWDKNKLHQITYGELFYQNEIEQSLYNFEYSNIPTLLNLFNQHISEAERLLLLNQSLILPAYEHILQATHNFNLIDARQILSSTERKQYISKIRIISTKIAKYYYKFRKDKGFPLLSINR
ncbi:Glycine--tRNA ligase alpha subunit [Buchnera aphidicola (Phyllaphis fagi)]|uniref:glycine--tRNA ligase subunit alpha n=1 Tax=Buchnera aphidicola TaxID=9 RepID=UPI003463E651